ncbi:MAG: hypothetical protein JJE15_15405 [Desulfobacteraceae bacterium]|nr:hypothetical protein [Desulfobacteraceae bacterium]
MPDTRIVLSGMWVALMLTYLLGDVLRIFAGDFKPGELELGGVMSPEMMWMISAITMTIPVVMIILSLILPHNANRWANIIVAILFFLYNLVGLAGSNYPSTYDKFLLAVSMAANVLTVWYAWKWV